MGLRGDAIVEFDWSVGQIMNTLNELGIAENTLIILTSDNGPVVDDGYDDRAEELLNGHQPTGELRGGKYSAFEGGTTIPFIVSWPQRIKQPMESGALFSQIDLMASLGELLQATLPKGSAQDSEKHLNTLLGQDTEGRTYVIEQAQNHTLSVRTKEWKYIEPSNGPQMIPWGPEIETGYSKAPQLYRMNGDRKEQLNHAGQNPDKVLELQEILRNTRE